MITRSLFNDSSVFVNQRIFKLKIYVKSTLRTFCIILEYFADEIIRLSVIQAAYGFTRGMHGKE